MNHRDLESISPNYGFTTVMNAIDRSVTQGEMHVLL